MITDPTAPVAQQRLAEVSPSAIVANPLSTLWVLRWPTLAGVVALLAGWPAWGPAGAIVALSVFGIAATCSVVFFRMRVSRELDTLDDLYLLLTTVADTDTLQRLALISAKLKESASHLPMVTEMAADVAPRRASEVTRTYRLLLWEGTDRLFDLARLWPDAVPSGGLDTALGAALDDVAAALAAADELFDALRVSFWERSSRLPDVTLAQARSMGSAIRSLN